MSKKRVSLFETEVKNTVFRWFIGLIIFGFIGLILIIIGSMLIRKYSDSVMIFGFSTAFLVPSLLFLVIFPGPGYYNKIEKLKEEENEVELMRIAEHINNRGSIALCALYDLSPRKVKPILDLYHVKGINPKTDMGFIKKLTKLMLEEEAIEKSVPKKLAEVQTIIPITKAYFIKNHSELKKGMISKAQLTLDYEVVICPYCSNMAKKDLLNEWLKEKNTCPVCFTKMTIDDCPVVDIRDN